MDNKVEDDDGVVCRYSHTETRGQWRMGLTNDDKKWLDEHIGTRSRNLKIWRNNKGSWLYLGSRPLPGGQVHQVRLLFRNKEDALLFKLTKV